MNKLNDEKVATGLATAWALEYMIWTVTFIIGTPFLFLAPNLGYFIYATGMVLGSLAWLYTMVRVSKGKEALPTESIENLTETLEDWSDKQEARNKAQWSAIRTGLPQVLKALWKYTKIAFICVIAFYALGFTLLLTGVIG
tara:strand:+ start:124 stop:546 length:423 start_codon:yes stop_codon:yes gene_type:complete